jgi:hypothetical protein
MLPTCQDMTRLLSDAMDRTLPFHMRLRMRIHLFMCALCERYKRQLTLLRDVLRTEGAQLHDDGSTQKPRLSAEAKERIARALDSHRT